MIIVVTDANILIDLCELNLLSPFFALHFKVSVVESVWDELSIEQQEQYANYLVNKSFELVKQETLDLLKVMEIKNQKQQLSIPDCSSLVYAMGVNGFLLTSDKNLRLMAKTMNIEYRGHLWVFDELVRNQVISPNMAQQKLNELRTNINPKLGLPVNECEERIKRWGKDVIRSDHN